MLNNFLSESFFCFLILISSFKISSAQSNNDYIPCSEMPNLMQHFNADYYALERFYTPAGNDSPFGFNGGGDNGASSPEKRERMKKLYEEYLQKLSQLDFEKLSQECRVDYILFQRDINSKLQILSAKAVAYEKIKQWIPFADEINELEKLRRRGSQLDGEKTAKEWFNISNEIKSLESKLKDDKIIS